MHRGVKPVCCPVVGCTEKYSILCRVVNNPHKGDDNYINNNMPLLSMKTELYKKWKVDKT
jgi:hypothetical protein